MNSDQITLNQLMEYARRKIGRSNSYDSLSILRDELRQRRKRMLGSYISLERMLCRGRKLQESAAAELCNYLAERTVLFWNKQDPEDFRFSQRFYNLAVYALTSGEVGNESIDDVIQLAECLVRSRDTFITVMKSLLPGDMIGELFDFTDSYDDTFYTANFEDAVMGAVSVFLGTLRDPVPHSKAAAEEVPRK